MTNEDAQHLFSQLQNLIAGVEQAKLVQEIVVAYDRFAESAMQALISAATVAGTIEKHGMYEAISQDAWKIADIMMAERAKRGLGFPPSLGPSANDNEGIPRQ